MDSKSQISISIPKGIDGMIGRECSFCKRYFKIKPGTGLKTNICNCPYCSFQGNSDSFNTSEQISYAMSKGMNNVLNDFSKEVDNIFRDFKKNSNSSFLDIKIQSSGTDFSVPIKYYSEKELETELTCDNCGLKFSIYGIFANCPDCTKMNAFLMFEKSIDVIKKQFDISTKSEIPNDVLENSLASIISNCISIFDSLGKEIRKQNQNLLPKNPKNLFQNIIMLNEILNGLIKEKHSNYEFLIKYFQVRHNYQHNMGVIDEDFIKVIPESKLYFGRKFILYSDKVLLFIEAIIELKDIIKNKFEK